MDLAPQRGRPMSDRRGIALAMALFALVLMGTLVAISFFVGRLEQQSGRNSFFAIQALEAAEAGISDAIGTLTEPALAAVAVGDSLALPDLVVGDRIVSSRVVVRLTGGLFLVRSTGHRSDAAGSQLATRGLGTLVKLVPDSISGAQAVRRIRERSWVEIW
jgi:hypothetical protein